MPILMTEFQLHLNRHTHSLVRLGNWETYPTLPRGSIRKINRINLAYAHEPLTSDYSHSCFRKIKQQDVITLNYQSIQQEPEGKGNKIHEKQKWKVTPNSPTIKAASFPPPIGDTSNLYRWSKNGGNKDLRILTCPAPLFT